MSALFLAAVAVTACEVEPLDEFTQDASLQSTTVSFCADAPETRTVFGSVSGAKYPVLWTSNQDVRIFPSTSFSDAINASVTPSKDQKTAKFNGGFTISETARVSFSLLSPASSFVRNEGDMEIRINVPASQVPTVGSPDEAAQILVDKTDSYRPAPKTVKFSPKHFTAYMAISFTNLPTLGRNPTVTVTSESAALSGTVKYSFEDGTITPVSTSKSVKASLVSQSEACMIACLPAQVAGTKLTILVKGGSGSASKEITVPGGKNLIAGKVATMKVDMKQTVAVTGVSLDKNSITVAKGKTEKLTATVSPSNATDKTVTWSSSKTSVATVSSDGVVTGVAPGNAVITVTTNDGGKTATCNVTVTNTVKKIEFTVREAQQEGDYEYDATEDVYHMCPGQVAYITYTTYYADGTSDYCKGGKLSVVSGSGISVSGYNVSCTASGKTATLRLTSTENSSVYSEMTFKTWDPVQSISLVFGGYTNTEELEWVKEGTSSWLQATVLPSTARQKVIVYKENNTGGWTVKQTGNLAFSITAPNVKGYKASDYTDKLLQLSIMDQTCTKTVVQKFKPSSANVSARSAKLFDIIYCNNNSRNYYVVDGGLRVLIVNNTDSDKFTIQDFYCESRSNTVRQPDSGDFVPVGVVTSVRSGITNKSVTSDNYPSVYFQYGIGDNVFVSKLEKGSFHGFAVALYDCADNDWSDSYFEDVDKSGHWNKAMGITHYIPDASAYLGEHNDDLRGFDLTVAAAYYNGAVAGRYCIRPVDQAWRYSQPGFEYDVSAWPSSVTPYKMRPWIAPTVANFLMIKDTDKSLTDGKVFNKLNQQITSVGGTKLFLDNSYRYWTINTESAQEAYYIGSGGKPYPLLKNAILQFRPFMVF